MGVSPLRGSCVSRVVASAFSPRLSGTGIFEAKTCAQGFFFFFGSHVELKRRLLTGDDNSGKEGYSEFNKFAILTGHVFQWPALGASSCKCVETVFLLKIVDMERDAAHLVIMCFISLRAEGRSARTDSRTQTLFFDRKKDSLPAAVVHFNPHVETLSS